MRGNEDYMEDLKEDVLSVTIGFEKEDRKFALDFLRKHVRTDALHQEAIEFFNNRTIVFGSGSVNPMVVVVTKDAIHADARKMLEAAFNKMGINESLLYFATHNFVATRRYIDERADFFVQHLSTLKPKIVISFDDIDYAEEVGSQYINTGILIEEIIDPDNKEVRGELNSCFKEIKSKLKNF